MAFLLQSFYLVLLLSQRCLIFKDTLLPSLFQSSKFRLLELTLSNEPSLIFAHFIGKNRLTLDITLCFTSLHQPLVCGKLFVHLRSQRTRP